MRNIMIAALAVLVLAMGSPALAFYHGDGAMTDTQARTDGNIQTTANTGDDQTTTTARQTTTAQQDSQVRTADQRDDRFEVTSNNRNNQTNQTDDRFQRTSTTFSAQDFDGILWLSEDGIINLQPGVVELRSMQRTQSNAFSFDSTILLIDATSDDQQTQALSAQVEDRNQFQTLSRDREQSGDTTGQSTTARDDTRFVTTSEQQNQPPRFTGVSDRNVNDPDTFGDAQDDGVNGFNDPDTFGDPQDDGPDGNLNTGSFNDPDAFGDSQDDGGFE